MITELAGEILADGGYDDLKVTYNRHSRSDFDAEEAALEADNLEVLKSAVADALGVDLDDADVDSPEALRELAEEHLRARESAHAGRKKSPKQAAREAAREAEKTQIGKTLQDIYRKLAVALHPDLEPDPAERARKTELMQRVNVAYEAKDLLLLLELQLRFEQVDPTKVDTIAEDRLRHYNAILDEQARQLDDELRELELPYRMALELSPSARLSPERVVQQIRVDAEMLRARVALVRGDTVAFQDIKQLKAWLGMLRSAAGIRGRGSRGGGREAWSE